MGVAMDWAVDWARKQSEEQAKGGRMGRAMGVGKDTKKLFSKYSKGAKQSLKKQKNLGGETLKGYRNLIDEVDRERALGSFDGVYGRSVLSSITNNLQDQNNSAINSLGMSGGLSQEAILAAIGNNSRAASEGIRGYVTNDLARKDQLRGMSADVVGRMGGFGNSFTQGLFANKLGLGSFDRSNYELGFNAKLGLEMSDDQMEEQRRMANSQMFSGMLGSIPGFAGMF